MKRATNTLVGANYQLNYFSVTDVGCRRSHNEDDFLVDDQMRIFAVADGVGGLSGGEIASHLALAECKSHMEASARKFIQPSSTARMTKAIENANTAVFQYGRNHHKRIATTLSLVLLDESRLHIANVGDSRVYRWRQGNLSQLTIDHTVRQEMIANGLMEQETPNEVVDHVITRAVGAEERVKVDIFSHPVQDKDVYLICTDGITSMLTDDEIRMVIRTMASPEQAGKVLLENAKTAGGKDNITLILLYIHKNQ